jgi:hypothetical protein
MNSVRPARRQLGSRLTPRTKSEVLQPQKALKIPDSLRQEVMKTLRLAMETITTRVKTKKEAVES